MSTICLVIKFAATKQQEEKQAKHTDSSHTQYTTVIPTHTHTGTAH